MPRRPSGRTKRYNINYSDRERAAWERAAKAANLDLANWIRVTLDKGAGLAVEVRQVPVVVTEVHATKAEVSP